MTLPSVVETEPKVEEMKAVKFGEDVDQRLPMVEPEPEPEAIDEMPVDSVNVVIPVAKLRTGYTTRRVDVQKMTGKQAEGMRKVVNGLIAEKAKLIDGRMVQRPQDAIKWIFEQV